MQKIKILLCKNMPVYLIDMQKFLALPVYAPFWSSNWPCKRVSNKHINKQALEEAAAQLWIGYETSADSGNERRYHTTEEKRGSE